MGEPWKCICDPTQTIECTRPSVSGIPCRVLEVSGSRPPFIPADRCLITPARRTAVSLQSVVEESQEPLSISVSSGTLLVMEDPPIVHIHPVASLHLSTQ